MNKINGGASRPKDVPPQKTEKVGVLGAGMMGQGIAYSSAMVGIQVVLKDISLAAAEKGKTYTETLLQKRVDKGRMTPEKMAEVLSLIHPTASDEDLDGCDLIIEAVFENMNLKHQMTRDLEPNGRGRYLGLKYLTYPLRSWPSESECRKLHWHSLLLSSR